METSYTPKDSPQALPSQLPEVFVSDPRNLKKSGHPKGSKSKTEGVLPRTTRSRAVKKSRIVLEEEKYVAIVDKADKLLAEHRELGGRGKIWMR